MYVYNISQNTYMYKLSWENFFHKVLQTSETVKSEHNE